jgi:hypothetical protein
MFADRGDCTALESIPTLLMKKFREHALNITYAALLS